MLKRYLEKIVLHFYQKGGGKDFMNHVVIIGFMGSGKDTSWKADWRRTWGCRLSIVDRLIAKKMNHVSAGDF